MCSMSCSIRFVRSYPLASFGHVQSFKWTPPDKDFRWTNVSCALVCGLSDYRASGILYVSVDVRSTRVVERSTSGHVTVKTDEYRMLNGHETHITDPCETEAHEIKTMAFIFLWNKIRLPPTHHHPISHTHFVS